MITTLIAIVNTLCTTGNKDFPANFKITDQAHVYVYFIDGDEEVPEVLLTQVTSFTAGEGNEYKVNSISETGFNVELRDAYDTSDGRKISTRRIVPVTQAIDYPPGNDFPAATHERALDKLTAIVQQFEERIIRQIGVPLSEDASGESLLMPAYISNYYLGLDGDNNLIWKIGTFAPGNDEIKDSHIDWGTGANQVSAVDIPIEDSGTLFTAEDIEAALAEVMTDVVTVAALIAAHESDLDDPHITLKRENVTVNKTMEVSKKYLISSDCELTLPSNPSIGDVIDILSDGFSKIIQNDAEHLMNLRNKYFTTKGTSGFVQMFPKERLELIYKGSGLNPIEPPVKVSALTAPEGGATGCSFSYDGTYLAVGHLTSPYITVYKRTGDTFTKVSALTAPEGDGSDCNFSYDGTYLAVSHSVSPYITVYKRTGDTFAKVSALTAPEGTGTACSFSYDGIYLAVGHTTSPYITVYKRSGDTFTKVSALTAPQGNVFGCSFSYDGIYLAVVHTGSPYITVYKRSGDTFTKVSALTALEGDGHRCSFSYDGTYLAVVHTGSPYVTVYKRTGDTFTKVSPLTAPEGNGYGCSFSYDGIYLSIGHLTSPYITVYKRTGDTFTKVSALEALEGGAADCDSSYNGTYMAVGHATSPYITVYKTKESINKEWIVTDFEVMNDEDSSDGDNGDLQYRFK